MKVIFTLAFLTITNFIIYSQSQNGTNAQMGLYHFNNSNFIDAKEYLLDAYNLKEFCHFDLNRLLGISYCEIADYKNAVKWLKKALDDPQNYEIENKMWLAQIYFFLGRSYEGLKNHSQALKHFELAQELGLDIPTEFKFEKDGWYYICEVGDESVYYLKKSLKKIKNGIIRVWEKWYWDDNSFKQAEIIEASKNGDPNLVKLKEKKYDERGGVQYSLELKEYDCINNRSRIIEVTEYDKKGNVLSSYNFSKISKSKDSDGWNEITPESVEETIINKICSLK